MGAGTGRSGRGRGNAAAEAGITSAAHCSVSVALKSRAWKKNHDGVHVDDEFSTHPAGKPAASLVSQATKSVKYGGSTSVDGSRGCASKVNVARVRMPRSSMDTLGDVGAGNSPGPRLGNADGENIIDVSHVFGGDDAAFIGRTAMGTVRSSRKLVLLPFSPEK